MYRWFDSDSIQTRAKMAKSKMSWPSTVWHILWDCWSESDHPVRIIPDSRRLATKSNTASNMDEGRKRRRPSKTTVSNIPYTYLTYIAPIRTTTATTATAQDEKNESKPNKNNENDRHFRLIALSPPPRLYVCVRSLFFPRLFPLIFFNPFFFFFFLFFL